jgi:hypothetical protein
VIQTELIRENLSSVIAVKLEVENKTKCRWKEPTIMTEKVKEEKDLMIIDNRSILLQKAKNYLRTNT